MSDALSQARALLHSVFGFGDFRPGQEEIVRTVLAGENVLAVMPTGSGKSLCYQLPAIVRPGLTLVISPLIALMRDQVRALSAAGVAAGSLNSSNEPAENSRVLGLLRRRELKLLYVAPERLARPDTVEMLAEADVSMMAIDEAHCVSQWGHDFRPEYLSLGNLARQIGGRLQTLAFTATADAPTRGDIVEKLFAQSPRTFVRSFDRPNLKLSFKAKERSTRQVLSFVQAHQGESGIIYCASRRKVEELAEALTAAGVRALPYHAGLDKAVRDANQDAFQQEDGLVMTATVAFGMGIDKPDVRFVCHADLPANVEAYYQEIGRAGRDGLPADTLTLYGLSDMQLRRLQIEQSESSDERKRIERQRLGALLSLAEAPRCRRQTLLAYFGEPSEPCGNCDLCQEGVELFDGTIEAQKVMSAVVRTGERFGMEHLVAILTGDLTDNVRKFNHERLPTFGVGKDRKPMEWRSIFRQLSAVGLIAQDLMEHGRWWVTDEGWRVLKGEAKIELRKDLTVPKAGARRDRRAAAAAVIVDDADAVLLDSLKALRTRLARAQNVPAYVVFSDRTLAELATHRPTTPGAMREIHGVGDAKLERYGTAFLEIIQGGVS
ncbi:MAG: DNA helicase RecQ [Reyranella sp.]|jgi:ATP-dependent DNA helicase RecQ|uniref:DNA helicase RecQ n=1 Tax=Reyranella sp. TaxID=1929291 RepID=UPI000967C160|nr:DNA helicase RecQ [Reyranella sp.]MBN9536905.1 DNA helicase RecQ [Alphaproteobacteria bacterium]MBR2816118.1 DNA helicase RecQ [Reyranella sp.]OJU34738.1 MAG: ATP-dependent DNA helicase RecQ [Alphaproteobacteria bacterium 65-37]